MRKEITAAVLIAAVTFGPLAAFAADKTPKPYPLKTCAVSDEKLGEHGKPYVFTHEGQEVKLCCKDCLKDFNKEPEKYMKVISAAQPKK
jgi:hypothetical protein